MRRRAAQIVSALFLASLLAACGGDSGATDSEADLEARIEAERQDAAQEARQRARIKELEDQLEGLEDGSDGDSGSAGATPSPSSSSSPSYTNYVSSGGGWSAEVPTGGGWSEGVETQVNPGLHRTTFTGPGGAVLLVDSTPGERPRYEGDAQRTTVEHPVYGSMERLVFRGNTSVTPCETSSCIDYLIPAGAGGYGVLVGGPGSFAELASIAETVALSIR